jgi:hypothetical protein
MRKLFVCLALFLTACTQPVAQKRVSWDTMYYATSAVSEPSGFIRMGK